MAERKATNKYYPPDWDPSKGSVNKHVKSHPLRDRARKIDQGILVVRFEMPFNIWCLKCENHIAMGVRYNAEKSKTGNYYSTPIYKFRMKCHLCDNHFEIQTDPSKFDYVILSGARRRAEPTQDSDSEEVEKQKLNDAMSRLEKKIEDKMEAESRLPNLHDLKKWRSRWEDSFSANQLIRSQFRARRKKLEQRRQSDRILLRKTSIKIPLAKPSSSDKQMAKELLASSSSYRCQRLDSLNRQKLLESRIETKMDIKSPKTKVDLTLVKRERKVR